MAGRAIMLLEHAPKFSAKGGLFYVDFGTEGLPTIALSPHIMLKAIGKARVEYERWAFSGDGDVAKLV